MTGERFLLIGELAYALTVEADAGFLLGEGREWEGFRVRYRAAGRRYWSSFLLIDHDHEPTDAELTEVLLKLTTAEPVEVGAAADDRPTR